MDLFCTAVSFATWRWKQRQDERQGALNLDGKVMSNRAGICLAPLLFIGAHANGGMSATLFLGTTASSSGPALAIGRVRRFFYVEGDAR
jgi:hypothetical protein